MLKDAAVNSIHKGHVRKEVPEIRETYLFHMPFFLQIGVTHQVFIHLLGYGSAFRNRPYH